jgi:hypothetical protein
MLYSTLVSHLSPIISLTAVSSVSSLSTLSSLIFHSLISLHDGGTPKNGVLREGITLLCSNLASILSSHLSPVIPLTALSSLSSLSTLIFHSLISLHDGGTPKNGLLR